MAKNMAKNMAKKPGKRYAYRYSDDKGRPLRYCPACMQDLTVPPRPLSGGVCLVLAGNAGRTWEVFTRLDEQGGLVDTPDDDDVAAGRHSATLCGGCLALLIDHPGVAEHEVG